jgi:glyoxylase-like metal-dependent hydrolase (beta-lactamase superfamily II)
MITVREFRAGLWLTEVDLAAFSVRGAAIQTPTHVVVWDTLSHPRDMEAISGLIGDRSVIIVYSHADWDHIWGTGALADHKPVIVAHELCERRFHGDVIETLAEKQSEEAGQWDDVTLIPPLMTFGDQMTLHLDGLTLELHHLAGHTEDCIVVYIPEWKILLAGDTVETPLPVINTDSDTVGWIEKLRQWAKTPDLETVIPSQGEIGGVDLLKHNVDYLEKLMRGETVTLPDEMTAFYRETHEQNLAILRKG